MEIGLLLSILFLIWMFKASREIGPDQSAEIRYRKRQEVLEQERKLLIEKGRL